MLKSETKEIKSLARSGTPLQKPTSGPTSSRKERGPLSTFPQDSKESSNDQPTTRDGRDDGYWVDKDENILHVQSHPSDEGQSDVVAKGGKVPIAVLKSFDDMNLNDDLLRGIYAYGFEKPSAIQQRAIVPVISGVDAVVQAQSGTGKTATFSIAALQRINIKLQAVQAVVLAPTRELAEQSQRVAAALGDYMGILSHACVGGTFVRDDIRAVKNCHFVVGTPGRIFHLLQSKALNLDNLKLLILDEADEMLDRGFRDQIYDIFQFAPEKTQVHTYVHTCLTQYNT